MSFFATTIAKRSVYIAAKYTPRALATLPVQSSGRLAFLSTEKVPPEDYYNGHLMADRLEYLDDMLDKTLEIESNMESLKETYAQKRQAYRDSASLDEMERLFLKAEEQKQLISAQIASLKKTLIGAKTAAYAVDAPDGTSDELEELFIQEANDIINDSPRQKVVKK